MKRKLLCILAFAVSTFVAQAETTLFSTDFSTTTGVTWSTTGADLTSKQASGGDYETWLIQEHLPSRPLHLQELTH